MVAGLICALGFAGCGSKKAVSDPASASSTEMATINAADNLVGNGVSSCDTSLTTATYDPSGRGSVTSVDGQPVNAFRTSADTSAASGDASADGTAAVGTDASADGTNTSGTDTSADGTDTSADGAGTSGTDTSADGTDTSDTGTSSDSAASSSSSASSDIDFSATVDSENQKAALCLASLDNISWASGITSFGGYTPSPAMLTVLKDASSSIDNDGKNFSYMIMDVNTYAGVCYNSDAHYYASLAAASAFIIGTLNADSSSLTSSGEEFQILAANGSSSQDTYTTLMNTYGFNGMNAWMQAGGVNTVIDGYGSAFLSAEDLTRIWLKNYQYFTTDTNGSNVETWFQSPSDSPVRTALGSKYTTFDLPGNYSGGSSDASDYITTVDAGVVSAGNTPYIIVVMSDYAAQPDKITPLVQALDAVHSELVSAAGLS